MFIYFRNVQTMHILCRNDCCNFWSSLGRTDTACKSSHLLRFRRVCHHCWFHAHTGIKGNEQADKLAMKASKLHNSEIIKVPNGREAAK